MQCLSGLCPSDDFYGYLTVMLAVRASGLQAEYMAAVGKGKPGPEVTAGVKFYGDISE